MSEDVSIKVELVLAEGEVVNEQKSIEEAGGQITSVASQYEPEPDELDDLGDSQFDPFVLISASLALGYLVKAISDVWQDHQRPGGQIVDASRRPVRVKRMPYVERGKLVIITKEGTQVLSTKERAAGEKLLAELLAKYAQRA